MTIKPGDYKVDVLIKATLNVSDLTQEEIDEHGSDVIRWAIMEDFDYQVLEVTKILNVRREG